MLLNGILPNNSLDLTGAPWNGQHGAFIADPSGTLGRFRHFLFRLHRTRSPLQPNPSITDTLFAEIDVHTAGSLACARDAEVAAPPAQQALPGHGEDGG